MFKKIDFARANGGWGERCHDINVWESVVL